MPLTNQSRMNENFGGVRAQAWSAKGSHLRYELDRRDRMDAWVRAWWSGWMGRSVGWRVGGSAVWVGGRRGEAGCRVDWVDESMGAWAG